MYSLRLFSVSLTVLFLSETLLSSESISVGRVVLSRGEVTAIRAGSPEEIYLLRGDIVYESDLIRTANNSVMKLKFVDNGNLTLGPNSEVRLEKFRKNMPGLINLLKGQIRSKVNKKIDRGLTTKEKFLIKTRNSALGVRGTDFEVRFNPYREQTTLLVHSGLVAISKYYSDRVDVSQILGHFQYGNGVAEIAAGEAQVNGPSGFYPIKFESYAPFQEADVQVLTNFTEKKFIPKKRHSSENVQKAMENAELNKSGALQNGL